MIVVKGKYIQSLTNELNIRQRLEAFFKYHSTQVMLAFAGVYTFWQTVPDDLKADLFNQVPFLAKWKTPIYITGLAILFYKSRMTTQVVSVAPPPEDIAPPRMMVVPVQQTINTADPDLIVQPKP